MTLFQLVTVENPLKLTPKARNLWPEIRKAVENLNLTQFLKEGLEGLEIGLALGKKHDEDYFLEMIERDLRL